jgi:DNA-binding CsgD family transcriptional regulator/tetratricopeptide (TPR) repeat protein
VGGRRSGRDLYGRDEQIAVVRAAMDRTESGFGVTLLTGPAGIGKTAIWERGVADAEDRGYAVLQARTCESEAPLSHVGLSDLLEDVGTDVLARLPVPQRTAIETALLRTGDGSVDPRALGAGFLSVVRDLAATGPVLIAVDDEQWLDPASRAAVMYALRRLRGEPVLVLLTRRTGPPSRYDAEGLAPELAHLAADVSVVDLPPLHPDAIRRLTDPASPVRLAHRVHELSGGNPYFALEIADALRRSDDPIGPGDDLPIPSSLQALVSARLASATIGARRAVLVTSLAGNPRIATIRDVLTRDDAGRTEPGDRDLDDATAAGLLAIHGDHVRLTHPLVGAVARGEAPATRRRSLHRMFADAATDIEARAWHRALGAVPPDAEIADELAYAADATAERGGPRAAAELSEQAWRFTPEIDPKRDERLLAAADRYRQAGLHDTVVTLLTPHLASFGPGPMRAHARLRIGELGLGEMPPEAYEEILAEADPGIRAETLALRASNGLAFGTNSMSQGLWWAAEAAAISATLDDPASLASVVSEAAWMEALLGTDPEPRLAVLDPGLLSEIALHDQGDRVRGVRAMWRGEVALAGRLLNDLRNLAREREEEWSEAIFTMHLFELAIRVGDWRDAGRLQAEFARFTIPPAVEWRVRGAVAAGTGDRELAEEALRRLDALDAANDPEPRFWDHMETRRAAGLAALFDGDAATAVTRLARVEADALIGEYLDPGVFPVGPDLVEALVKAGRADDARAALDRLDQTAAEQDHPWARAGAARARGILLSASADDAAEDALNDAVDRYRTLGLPFDEARAIAAIGSLRRRQRRFREARTLLQDAADRFDGLGASTLARSAHAEIGRVGGRPPEPTPASGGLTATEQQVVALVAAGCTNRQTADRLFISVSAVEAHLTRVYAKLGLTSRTQLVRHQSKPV